MIEVLAANAGLGKVISSSLLQTRSALAAIPGRPSEAERSYRDAIVVWRQLGMVPDIATAQMEMLRLLGDRLEDREALAAEARQVLSDIGAVTLLARLDEIAPVETDMELVR